MAYANLIAVAMTIPENRDEAAVKELATNTKTGDYVPKKIKVKLPGEEEKKDEEPAAPEDEEMIPLLEKELDTLI